MAYNLLNDAFALVITFEKLINYCEVIMQLGEIQEIVLPVSNNGKQHCLGSAKLHGTFIF